MADSSITSTCYKHHTRTGIPRLEILSKPRFTYSWSKPYYGDRSSDLSSGLPHDSAAARQFFDASLQQAWIALKHEPYDFLVQSPTWKLGAASISILRKQFDRTYVGVAFDNHGLAVTMNFIVVSGPGGWVIYDAESPHDSLRMFLAHYRGRDH